MTVDKQLVAAALQGITANPETMREIINKINTNSDIAIDYHSAIALEAVKYAQATQKILGC